eukprot:scaffold217615_cov19-Tisochrysis_lutea.AAC.1
MGRVYRALMVQLVEHHTLVYAEINECKILLLCKTLLVLCHPGAESYRKAGTLCPQEVFSRLQMDCRYLQNLVDQGVVVPPALAHHAPKVAAPGAQADVTQETTDNKGKAGKVAPYPAGTLALSHGAVASAVEGALVEVLGHALPTHEPLMSGMKQRIVKEKRKKERRKEEMPRLCIPNSAKTSTEKGKIEPAFATVCIQPDLGETARCPAGLNSLLAGL